MFRALVVAIVVACTFLESVSAEWRNSLKPTMKYLITKPVTVQSKPLPERIEEYMNGAHRKTQGGIALFIMGFFLQIIGMSIQQIFFA